ncbi:MAG: PHP domain-containing protein [Anaerolineaceae bacterium]|nr:PHP domain-containing protein [Anaerolineaceae bacterium]
MSLPIFRSDLHVHTVLSPCAEIEMIPSLIVEEALAKGIQLIAITDHNASYNVSAVIKASENSGLIVLPGMEIQTKEEVHVLCLFDNINQLEKFQVIVNKHLPPLKNKEDYFGYQLVVDESGNLIRTEEQLLLTSTNLSIDQIWGIVEELNGIIIPAHVNRKVNGLIEILGFVPEEIPIIALEVSRHITPEKAKIQFPQINTYPVIQNGDVHRLSEFLGSTYFSMKEPTIKEIKLALQGKEGRSFQVLA